MPARIAMIDRTMLAEPLQFQPILKQYLWGGRRLESELGKPLGDGPHYAESWEVVDHGDDQSVVVGGPSVGATLHGLVTEHGDALFGRHDPRPQFPLMFKFLDCQRTLSVQVHPNDAQAALLDPPDLGKTEAWFVLAAKPRAKIYAGLKPGVERATLERSLAAGSCETCLHEFEPQPGDCVLLEAQTVHALGAGLLVAEIQQASNTTYRLFDWNRIDADGKPRQLHVNESLDTIDYARGPVAPSRPRRTERPHVERLVACDKFVLDRWRIDGPQPIGGDERFHIIAVVEGAATVGGGDRSFELARGGTALLPAAAENVSVSPRPQAILLDMYLP
jgi:mannose-6-phosphate isomerase